MKKIGKHIPGVFRIVKVFFYRFGILALSAVLLSWYLQYRYFGNDSSKTWQFLDNHALVFWYSTLILFSIALLFYGIFRGPFKSIAILFGIITIFGYINITKFQFRGSPLLPEDFQMTDQAGTLTKFIDFGNLIRTIIAVILAISLGFLLDYLADPYLKYFAPLPKLKKKKQKTKRSRKMRRNLIAKKVSFVVLPRLVVIPIAIIMFFAVANQVINHSGKKEEYIPEIGAHFIGWSQVENYDENGFLVGFLYNMKKQNMTAPKDYSEATIDNIKKRYSSNADQTQKTLKDIDYNIIIVLNESFFDPSIISDYYEVEGEDITPNLHKIQEKYQNGYMYSPDYGGGTANIEFEVITGLSNYWANTVPYTDILTKIPSVTSISKDAKSAGYKTTAIHSFTGEMYKRQIALIKEGFDQFITENEMSHTEKEGMGEYIKDSELYTEVIELLKKNKEKQFIFAITMQNHAPYAYGKYPHEDYRFWVPRLAEDFDRHASVLSYLQTLYNADKYMGDFLTNLDDMDEKTVVLFFGDHAPGVFPDVHDSEDKTISDLSHLTPYFIWTNFDISDIKKDSIVGSSKNADNFIKKFNNVPDSFDKIARNITLPVTTPNCLTDTMYSLLGLRKDSRHKLLEVVCDKEPILTPVYLGNNSPEKEKVVQEYELLNYDILGGKQYWLK